MHNVSLGPIKGMHSAGINTDSTDVIAKKWTKAAEKIVLLQVILATVNNECCSWDNKSCLLCAVSRLRICIRLQGRQNIKSSKNTTAPTPNLPKQIISFLLLRLCLKQQRKLFGFLIIERRASSFIFFSGFSGNGCASSIFKQLFFSQI